MAALRARKKLTSSVSVPDDVFVRALTRIRGMTKSQRIKSLKDAGILTPRGQYAKPYRSVEHKRVA